MPCIKSSLCAYSYQTRFKTVFLCISLPCVLFQLLYVLHIQEVLSEFHCVLTTIKMDKTSWAYSMYICISSPTKGAYFHTSTSTPVSNNTLVSWFWKGDTERQGEVQIPRKKHDPVLTLKKSGSGPRKTKLIRIRHNKINPFPLIIEILRIYLNFN